MTKFDAWVIWEFLLKEIPVLFRVAGYSQCFQPFLLSTAHSSLWLLVFSTNDLCYRLLGSALWLVSTVGQMLPGLSIDCLQ